MTNQRRRTSAARSRNRLCFAPAALRSGSVRFENPGENWLPGPDCSIMRISLGTALLDANIRDPTWPPSEPTPALTLLGKCSARVCLTESSFNIPQTYPAGSSMVQDHRGHTNSRIAPSVLSTSSGEFRRLGVNRAYEMK